MTSVRKQGCPAQKSQAFEAFNGSSSNRSNNGDHTDPLGSNKPKLFKVFADLEAPAGPFQAPTLVLQNLSTNQYSQQDLDKII